MSKIHHQIFKLKLQRFDTQNPSSIIKFEFLKYGLVLTDKKNLFIRVGNEFKTNSNITKQHGVY